MTLIFYSIGREFWQEPFLNLVAAAAQMSFLTHVEIAIGTSSMSLVLYSDLDSNVSCCVLHRRRSWKSRADVQRLSHIQRLYRLAELLSQRHRQTCTYAPRSKCCMRSTGVELTSRTGRNPQARCLPLLFRA